VEVVASLSQGCTAAAQCGLFTHKSVPVIFEPPSFYCCSNIISNTQSYRNDRKRLKNKLYRYLISHSFYSSTEFLECKIDKDNI